MAASLWGIEPQFWDIWGNLHVTTRETKEAILKARGVPIEDLAGAVDRRIRLEWERALPPAVVISEAQQPKQLPASFPVFLSGATARLQIRFEDGSAETLNQSLGDLPEIERLEPYIRKLIPLPGHLPLGYHEVELSIGDERRANARLIVTPDRAWLPGDCRSAGIAIPLYGLRSARNWGCGDFTDLRAFIDWAAREAGAGFVALNPLHAIHNRRPYNTSPYLPNSTYYQNLLYLDIEAIEDFERSARARRLFAAVQGEIEDLRGSESVEYERVHALKLRFLKLLFPGFRRSGSARAAAFQEFADREGDLLDQFATWCALDEFIHRRDPRIWIWPEWPEELQHPDSPGVRAFQKKHWRSVLFYKYVQWQIDLQLAAAQQHALDAGMSIGLYHDLALATDRYGSDFWNHRSFHVSGCRVGSPPDDFSPQGQDWAFPPPDSDRHRETGYRLFIESIRRNCRHGRALRIDHVMRFFRLYWIPDGSDAAHGAYVRDRFEDLIRILALESVRQRVILIGEDLGTVAPEVRETLARFGILSYRLFYFEKNERGEFRSIEEYPEQALVSSTTHDLPTLAGFWICADIEARRRAGIIPDDRSYTAQRATRASEKQKMLDLLFRHGLLPAGFPRSAAEVPELTGELHNAIIGFLALTRSRMMVVNQEDLTKETEQQNLPGTTWQYPNWSRKMRFSIEQLHSEKMARDFVFMFRKWLQGAGRSR